jgi:L-lactate dehydrogenase complex protein LldE
VSDVRTEPATRRVALFATCLTDTFYPDTARAVVRLLERLGCSVEFPMGQTCCGQMHFNTGYRAKAAPLARNVAKTFAGYDAVVVPSGSCAGMIRHVYPDLDVDPGPTYELSEFLIDVLGVEDVGAYFPHRVTYHPTCHSLRMLGVGDRPLRLLKAVKGLDLVELPAADTCCGFGGTFAVKNADVSSAMLADKMTCVLETGADVVTAGDNSCLMHIGGGLSRLQDSADARSRERIFGVHPLHLAEILASTEEEPWTATR